MKLQRATRPESNHCLMGRDILTEHLNLRCVEAIEVKEASIVFFRDGPTSKSLLTRKLLEATLRLSALTD